MMGGGATSLLPLSTTLNPALCPPASRPSCTLVFRGYPLPFSPPSISRGNAEKLNSASLFLYGRRTGCKFLISVTERRRGGSGGVEAANSDGDDDDDRWEEAVAAAEEDEEEEEGEVLPFQEMRRWLQNRPTGFGEGKTYDTTAEETLLEEMERSRKAQPANINKLRSSPMKTAGTKEQVPERKEIEVVPSGVRVRVSNLPRKKNIHRDLLLAFNGFSGIVNISPTVTGNRKTRDPICKGVAFLDLESEEAADRFVQKYSKKNVLFGKVEKQITCNIINRHRTSDSPEEMTDDTKIFTRPQPTELGAKISERSEINNLSPDSHEKSFSDGSTNIAVIDQTGKVSTLTVNGLDYEERERRVECLNISLSNDAKNGGTIDGDDDSSSLPGKQTKQAASRKKIVKTKSVKSSKLSVSGSMARLKVKERAVLTGVFSKYGGKVTSDLSKRS